MRLLFAVLLLVSATFLIGAATASRPALHQRLDRPQATEQGGQIQLPKLVMQQTVGPAKLPGVVRLPQLRPDRLYSLSIHQTGTPFTLEAALISGKRTLATRELHGFDRDMTLLFRPQGDSRLRLQCQPTIQPSSGRLRIRLWEWSESPARTSGLAYEPNDDWRHANLMRLGEPVFGWSDVTPFIPRNASEETIYVDATRKDISLTAGARTDGNADWLRFTLDGRNSKLVYFALDLPERDNIPPDVSVFVLKDGRPAVYEEGLDPVTPPHEVQALPGNKFTTRVLKPGTYYVRVIANHPEWVLRTQVLDPPPYTDPRQAVRAAADFLLGSGDSWHANTPRAGSRPHRVANVHADSMQCVACHPTHFATRGALAAMKQGYRPERMEALRFLTERLANNPRPFYGHPGADWARMISSAANVMGRLNFLVNETASLTGRAPASNPHAGALGYLKLYYKGRKMLPDDESNGNLPLVSQYEVLTYAWKTFADEFRRAGSEQARQSMRQLGKLASQDRHKNLIDLCWQTVALCEMGHGEFHALIERNCRRLLDEQRPDGSWSALLEPGTPGCEFQTGHALYALALAGYSAEHPTVKRGVEYLLARQQPWGGWLEPEQRYENFRTPFRETQFAVMALSRLYPENRSLEKRPPATGNGLLANLRQIDLVRGRLEDRDRKTIGAWLSHGEPLLRGQALLALYRADAAKALPLAARHLGDPSRIVRRAAAVATRFLATRGGAKTVLTALSSADPRTREGALGVFSYHFRTLARDSEVASALLSRRADPSPLVRMHALKSLWQCFWWNPEPATRERIARGIVSSVLDEPEPYVARNAREALYNIADENVRYLYNNWIPLLGEKVDRDRAAAAQRVQEAMLARLLAGALDRANSEGKRRLLSALTEFHLRTVRGPSQRYGRIANDVETVRFLGEAATLFAPAIERATKHTDPRLRWLAVVAALMLRDNGPLPLGNRLIEALSDPDALVRSAAAEISQSVPADLGGSNRNVAAASLAKAIAQADPAARLAALETAFGPAEIDREEPVRASIAALFEAPKETLLPLINQIAAKSGRARRDPRVLGSLADALLGSAETARGALAVIAKDPGVVAQPAIRNALNELARGGSELSNQALDLLQKTSPAVSSSNLDLAYFARKVMPLFAKKSSYDGNACVGCHFNHNLFRISAPGAQGSFSQEQVREGYRSALKVIDTTVPEKSLLLLKPVSTAASEGLVGASATAHGGGQRWSGPEDPDYQIVLSWIKGARIELGAAEAAKRGPP